MSDNKFSGPEEMTLSFENAYSEEEKEKLKKKKAALNYFTAAYCDALKERREAEFINSILPFDAFIPEYKKKIPQEFQEAQQIIQTANEVRMRRDRCFSMSSKDENAGLKAKLTEVGIGEKNFSAMALCAAVRNFEGVIEYINSGKVIENLEQKQKTSLEDLNGALDFYKKGVSVYMAYMIANGLEKCVKGFKDSKDKKSAIIWSEHISAILNILDEKPELKEGGGLEKRVLEDARKASAYGVQIKKGAEAIEKLAAADLGTSQPLTASEKDRLLYDVVGMSIAMYKKDPAPDVNRNRSMTVAVPHP